MKILSKLTASLPLAGGLLAAALMGSTADAATVEVTVENIGGGTFNTPLFVGFHDGSFDFFDVGSTASTGIEALAEDGNNSPIIDQLTLAGTTPTGFIGGNVFGPDIPPFRAGESSSATFEVDLMSNASLSVGTMVLPTNDWFLGTTNGGTIDLSNLDNGPITFDLNRIYDAGTEVNDFNTSAANGLFGLGGGQNGPNQGVDENDLISFVGQIDANGQLIAPTGGIIADPFADFANAPAGFNPELSSLRVTVSNVTAVPEPGSMLALTGMAVVAYRRRRRSK